MIATLEGTKLEGVERYRVWCPGCRKWGYPTEGLAVEALRSAREHRLKDGRKRRVECAVYEGRCGSFHLTSRRQG